MKFPYAMLRDFVETPLDAHQIGDLLTMAGFELEGIEVVGADHVLDIKVMANRGDGLSVLGLAREVLAKDPSAKPTELYLRACARFPIDGTSATQPLPATVEISTSNCTRYACRMFQGDFSLSTPDWIKTRLSQSGMRPISLLVDLTNYVMLEVGQPLHAFDFDTLRGGKVIVRQASDREKLTTLDGTEHQLNSGQMMICDAERPIAAAGVMGGAETEVSQSTKVMLLESAHFVNTSVRKTRKQMGLNTEASYRFERSVDPDGVVAALNRFAMLLGEADGGKSLMPGLIDVYPSPPKLATIDLRVSRSNLLLGMDVAPQDAKRYLQALGFGVEGDGEPFRVTAPSWRIDIEREDDLIEEIGRVHGYDKIPEHLPEGTTTVGGVFGISAIATKLKLALLRCGFSLVVNYSFEATDPLDDPWVEKFGPRNPTSPEMGQLRSSLLPGLALSVRRNGGKDLHLFEIGRVFGRADGKTSERQALSVISTGALQPEHWVKSTPPQADFFSLKGTLEEAFAHAERPFRIRESGDDPRLHPTRQAAILDEQGKPFGYFGQIHPTVATTCDLPPATLLASFFLEPLAEEPRTETHLRSISRNPAVRRDIAILIAKSVPYADMENAIRGACGEELEKLWVFDVYSGQGVPEGHQSVGIAMQLRKQGGNFTDEEANQVRDRAVAALVPLGGSAR